MADASQNGELQEVIRKGRMPEIQSIAVCFYSNTTRSFDALIISERFKISRQLLLGNCRGAVAEEQISAIYGGSTPAFMRMLIVDRCSQFMYLTFRGQQ